jgi:epi-isozizaene 5-monooxygenase
MLSLHPHVQEKLYAEIMQKADKNVITAEDLKQMNYVKNVISESLRIRTPITSNTRTLEHETVIKGYRIPAKVSGGKKKKNNFSIFRLHFN